ncbi:MAG: DUF2334 domain-containing protein [Desulfobacteraceae bacterium]|nr:DUF2334 domain-containing protein [Desulfobacteraceae bacterium]
MKFLIRDDDTCAFTRVEDLEKCYASIRPHIPVGLSVTPFRIPGKIGSFSRPGQPSAPTPLGDNGELVSFLKEGIRAGHFSIALHGYSHVVTNRNGIAGFEPWNKYHVGREYYYGTDLVEKTRSGRKYLSELLQCRIDTFVPPGNAISEEGMSALIDQKLNLIGSKGLGFRALFRKKPYPSSYPYADFFGNIRRHGLAVRKEYPYVADFKSYKEVAYYTLAPHSTISSLKGRIDYVHSVDGVFILSTHYHEFGERTASGELIADGLRELLEYANRKSNVSFISYDTLWGGK